MKKNNDLFENKEKLENLFKYFKNKRLILKVNMSTNLVDAHIEKSEHNLDFVNDLNNKYSDWKIIGLYYSLYHLALALVYNKGFKSENHTATLVILIKYYSEISHEDINLFDDLRINKEDVEFYSLLKQDRHNANYSSNIIFSNDKIDEYKLKVIQFRNKIKNILDKV